MGLVASLTKNKGFSLTIPTMLDTGARVLVARAFNQVYNLKLTLRGEMEFAYLGEITTPSQCGRMDQGCAYGNRPIAMVFDNERAEIIELKAPKNLYLVLVDLNAGKKPSFLRLMQ